MSMRTCASTSVWTLPLSSIPTRRKGDVSGVSVDRCGRHRNRLRRPATGCYEMVRGAPEAPPAGHHRQRLSEWFLPALASLSLLSASGCALLLFPPSSEAAPAMMAPPAQKSGTKIAGLGYRRAPRNVAQVLRRATPSLDPVVDAASDALESVAYQLRIPQRKPFDSIGKSAREVARSIELEGDRLFIYVPEGEARKEAESVAAGLQAQLKDLDDASYAKDYEKCVLANQAALDFVGRLKLLQTPGLPYSVPPRYASLPRLAGRGEVVLGLKHRDGREKWVNADATLTDVALIRIVMDGYSAPLTAGHFADLVVRGAYNGGKGGTISLSSDSAFVGRIGQTAKDLPFEMMLEGDLEPSYGFPPELYGSDRPVLPLSLFGAVAAAHPDGEPNAADQRFFFYLFDPGATSGGQSFYEGQYSVFGYVQPESADLLYQLRDGDEVVSAKLVQGQDRLERPGGEPSSEAEEGEDDYEDTPSLA